MAKASCSVSITGTQTWCTARQCSMCPGLASQVQQSCKPHWLVTVIHTHYYFTSSGTTALTAPVSPALIREKAPSQLTVVYLYNLPSHAAARWRHADPHTHIYDYRQINKTSMEVCSVRWHVQVCGDHTASHEMIKAGHHKNLSNPSDSKCHLRKQEVTSIQDKITHKEQVLFLPDYQM